MKGTTLFILLFSLAFHSVAQNLVWAESIKGSAPVNALDIAVDNYGQSYILGTFMDTVDVDPGIGISHFIAPYPQTHTYIVKLDDSGNFLWGKQIRVTVGGQHHVSGKNLALDGSGGLIVAGTFKSTVDFDPSVGSSDLTANGGTDIFILKLDTAGSFQWVKHVGGVGNDVLSAMDLDNYGNILLAGSYSYATDFDPGVGTETRDATVDGELFTFKLNYQGDFEWCHTIGTVGQMNDWFGIHADNFGNVYSVGRVAGNITILKLRTSSGNLAFSKTITNPGNFANTISCVGTDLIGNIYVSGVFYSATDVDPGAGTFNLNAIGDGDIFVEKLDSTGNFSWVKQLGGVEYETAHSIATDSSGAVYLSGIFIGPTDFDPGAGNNSLSAVGTQNYTDLYYLKLNSLGQLMWVHQIGGTGAEFDIKIAISPLGTLYVVGAHGDSCDFDPGVGSYVMDAGFTTDGFILKLSSTVTIPQVENIPKLILVYPNPSTGYTIVESKELIKKLEIVDVLGKQIFNIQPDNYLNKIELDLASGIYFVKVHSGGREIIEKLVINK